MISVICGVYFSSAAGVSSRNQNFKNGYGILVRIFFAGKVQEQDRRTETFVLNPLLKHLSATQIFRLNNEAHENWGKYGPENLNKYLDFFKEAFKYAPTVYYKWRDVQYHIAPNDHPKWPKS